jgi:hypothetical protein
MREKQQNIKILYYILYASCRHHQHSPQLRVLGRPQFLFCPQKVIRSYVPYTYILRCLRPPSASVVPVSRSRNRNCNLHFLVISSDSKSFDCLRTSVPVQCEIKLFRRSHGPKRQIMLIAIKGYGLPMDKQLLKNSASYVHYVQSS